MHFQYSLHKLLLNKLLLLQQSTLFYLLLVTFLQYVCIAVFFFFLFYIKMIVSCLSARFAGECRTKGRNEWNLLVSVA